MLERITNMPDGTIGLAAKGAVTTADCERTLLPLVAGWPASDQHTAMLLQFGPEFEDFKPDLWGGDAWFAFNHRRDFGRLAVVSDVAWLRKAVRLLAPFMGGEVRLFHDYQMEQAKTWIASPSSAPTLASYRSTARW